MTNYVQVCKEEWVKDKDFYLYPNDNKTIALTGVVVKLREETFPQYAIIRDLDGNYTTGYLDYRTRC